MPPPLSSHVSRVHPDTYHPASSQHSNEIQTTTKYLKVKNIFIRIEKYLNPPNTLLRRLCKCSGPGWVCRCWCGDSRHLCVTSGPQLPLRIRSPAAERGHNKTVLILHDCCLVTVSPLSSEHWSSPLSSTLRHSRLPSYRPIITRARAFNEVPRLMGGYKDLCYNVCIQTTACMWFMINFVDGHT